MPRRKLSIAACLLCIGAVLVSAITYLSPLEDLSDHQDSVKEVLDLLQAGRHAEALQLLDSLHTAVVGLRSSLRGWRLSGNVNTLSDPLDFPTGTYRVHFTTEGFGAVKLYDMGGSMVGLPFNLAPGQASSGATTLFRSSGERIMVEFSNISAPYTLVFESIE